MKDLLITIVSILCIFGLCCLLGFASRKTAYDKTEADKPINVVLRGLGFLILIFSTTVAVLVVIYVLTIPFR